MKKIFTFAAAILASFSLWAAEPNFESYDWQSQEAAEAVAGNHDGIVISYAGLGALGNVSGHWYIPNNQNLKNSDNPWKYFGIAANAQIDSVAFLYCPNGSNATSIAWAAWGKDVTPNQYILGHGVTAGTTSSKSWDNAIWETIDLSGIEAYTVYMSRNIREFREIGGSSNIPNFGGGQTINILGVRVWTKETKQAKDTTYTLTALAVNGEAVSADQLNTLISTKTLALAGSYVTAPELTFTEKMVITYVDESTKESTKDYKKSMEEVAGAWSYTAKVGENNYTVTAAKAASYKVTYMDGAIKLGEETVVANGKVAENAKYETKAGASFIGWYTDAELTDAADLNAAITADITFYGKWDKAYFCKNVNIEKAVLDYGTKYDIKSALTAAGIWYENLNDLDTLNDLENKTNRNYAFLGLKIKKQGGYLATNLKANGMLLIKFGNVGGDVKCTLKGATTDKTFTFTAAEIAASDNVLPVYGYTEDIMIKMETTSDKTVVIQQIMMDEIAEVVLPAPGAYLVTVAEAENGKVTVNWPNKKYRTPVGETVTITATPAEDYDLEAVTVDGTPLEAVEGVYSFVMPAKEVTVAATFKAKEPTAIENTDAAVKAVKVVRNGQMFIQKNGVLYNMQGAVVK